MLFKKLIEDIKSQFEKMSNQKLFKTNLTDVQLWDTYINSFKEENDPIFRNPDFTTHTCNKDRHWIKHYSNVVAVDKHFNLITVWDFHIDESNPYYDTVIAMRNLIRNSSIESLFLLEKENLIKMSYGKVQRNKYQVGYAQTLIKYPKEKTFDRVKADVLYTFNHFHFYLPESFVKVGSGSLKSEYNGAADVLEQSLEMFSISILELAYELCEQNSILNGTTIYSKVVSDFIKLKEQYNLLSESQKSNFSWENASGHNKLKNTAFGTFLTDLSVGKLTLEEAVIKVNQMIDPINYKKATTPITAKQKEEAIRVINELGYAESFNRRSATLDDVKEEYINFVNTNQKAVSTFDVVKASKNENLNLVNLREITLDELLNDYLKGSKSLEIYFENRLENNLVTLHTSNEDAKNPFKWNNNFGWTYRGGLTGKSQIKQNVEKVGGKTDGVLRCSLQWNDEDTCGIIDYDLHCNESINDETNTIYFSSKRSLYTKGWLDVDMIRPTTIGIENITYPSIQDGVYKFRVHQYSSDCDNKGFKVEIEFNGQVFNYFYSNKTKSGKYYDIATVTVKDGIMSIKHHMDNTQTSKNIWSIDTNQFHQVVLSCVSPNYWKNNRGNKHYFFFLNGCKNDEPTRGFHTDFLNEELSTQPTRKFVDIFGSTYTYKPSEKQLSGIGFDATVKESFIVRIGGKGLFKVNIN